jgi:hypothetical protein
MIEFKKKVKKLLPYDRKKYKSRKEWFGFSFQLPGVFEGKDIGLEAYLEVYEDWFKSIVFKFPINNQWIVNHDFIDEDWFPNKQKNLKNLRALFKKNSIPNTFNGAIIFTSDDLIKFSRDLISYPYAVFNKTGLLYNNLDISNSELPFVIKISGHLNIDLLSTDNEFLRKFVNENSSKSFILKEYNTNKKGLNK